MSEPVSSVPMSTDQIEERFLTALQVRPFPVPELLEMLVVLHSCGLDQRRDDCLLVLQETFADQGECAGLIRLFELRSSWAGNRPALGNEFRELLSRVLKDRLGEAQLDSVGFGTLSPVESLRRLQLLLSCGPGALCLDKTWGFGIVRQLDEFYRRMTVDFESRPNHSMTFAYAAETLRLLNDQHILAVRHADRGVFETMTREHPGDVVRMALRSFGPMPAGRLEETFVNHNLLPAADWKRFWSAARNALKKDPLVRIPPATKKSEPVELLTRAVTLGDATWFEALAKLRDVAEILEHIGSLEGKREISELDPSARAILVDRLEFAYRATETSRDQASQARTVILAASLGIEGIDLGLWMERVSSADFVCAACVKLPARDIERLVKFVPLQTDISAALSFLDAIPEMPYALMDVVLPLLLRGIATVETVQAIREEFTAGTVPLALLLWLARHQSEPDIQSLMDAAAVATQCLAVLDAQESGERLRLQHQIARRFEDLGWLEGMLARMTDVERQALNEKIHACEDGWEPAMKRSILGHLLKTYPELGQRRVVSLGASALQPAQKLTSWRSYNARMEKRRKLVEEDLPANSRDIAVARSYGDLRENFEYQSAKDTQRQLLQRQAQLDAEIKAIKGTDFAGLGTDTASMGSSVTVQTTSGGCLRFHILGEWDSDEALSIVPCRSRVAESLEGHVAGDTVSIPSESGETEAVVVAVEPLPSEILDWAMGRRSGS